MRKPKTEYEKISVQMTLAQKNQLERMAALENKSVSAYVRDIVFSSTLDTAKIDFYQNINDNLSFLKKENYRIVNLLVAINHMQLGLSSKEKVIEFFNKIIPQKKN